jgi:hypothetical protein
MIYLLEELLEISDWTHRLLDMVKIKNNVFIMADNARANQIRGSFWDMAQQCNTQQSLACIQCPTDSCGINSLP